MRAAFKNQDLCQEKKCRLFVYIPVTTLLTPRLCLSESQLIYLIEREQAPALHPGAYAAEKLPVEARETFLLKGPKESAPQGLCHRNHSHWLLLQLPEVLLLPPY